MGTVYTSAVGAPPVCTKLAFRRWCKRLLNYRLAECPIARGTTYYFSTSGSDSNDGLSPATPKQTVSAANTLIASLPSNANAAILFNRGDKWTARTVLTVAKNNITIGAYGTGARPVLSWWVSVANGSWTATAGRTNVYEASVSTQVAAFRMRDDLEVGFVKCTSVADVEATNGSWYWDSGANKLYMKPYENTPGSGYVAASSAVFLYEYCVHNVGKGINASGNGIRIDNIKVDGAGAQDTFNNDSNYGIYWTPSSATDCCVVSECECYYSESHNIGTTTSGAGGILTIYNCRMGWMTSTNSGAPGTLAISYAALGGNEAIFWGNSYCSAQVASKAVAYSTRVLEGAAGYGHTSGGANVMSLALSFNERVEPSMFQCQGPTNWGSVPDYTDLVNSRAWVVNFKYESRGKIRRDDDLASTVVYIGTGIPVSPTDKVVYINLDMRSKAVYDNNPNVNRYFNTVASLARLINCYIEGDWSGSVPNSFGTWRSLSASSGNRIHMYNTTVLQKIPGIGAVYLDLAYGEAQWTIFNSVIAVNGTANTQLRAGLSVTNSADFLKNNFYALDSAVPSIDTNGVTGYNTDATGTQAPNYPILNSIDASSPIVSANTQLVMGYPLEYDIDWEKRASGSSARGCHEYVRDFEQRLSQTDVIVLSHAIGRPVY